MLSQICCNPGSELDRPTADGLIGDLNPALGQQLFDVAEAEREAEIEPDRMAYDVRPKSVSFEGQGIHCFLRSSECRRDELALD